MHRYKLLWHGVHIWPIWWTLAACKLNHVRTLCSPAKPRSFSCLLVTLWVKKLCMNSRNCMANRCFIIPLDIIFFERESHCLPLFPDLNCQFEQCSEFTHVTQQVSHNYWDVKPSISWKGWFSPQFSAHNCFECTLNEWIEKLAHNWPNSPQSINYWMYLKLKGMNWESSPQFRETSPPFRGTFKKIVGWELWAESPLPKDF